MKITAIKTRVFKESEDLINFIIAYVHRLPENSILLVTSKIVALAEGRTAVAKDAKSKEKLIRSESELALPTKYCWLTIKDGQIMASAGIDESNGNGKLILLPKDSFRSARLIRKKLLSKFRLKNLGIIITDSRTMPLRAGVMGMAVGYAGIKGVRDYRGRPDIFGRKLHFSRTDVVDSMATAAVLVMGEGAERCPLVVINDAPVEFCQRLQKNELYIDIKDDMYRPLFEKVSKR
ncbi:MAG: coenzyme F420-0:L-glutamate ligase [Patescibacteria group bacterium]|jgi:coenzyme F420-0:L-glutamate ligase